MKLKLTQGAQTVAGLRRVLRTFFVFIAFSSGHAHAWTFLESMGIKEQEDYVQISVSIDASSCSDPVYPLAVTIANGYNEALTYTRFSLSGRTQTRSSEVYGEPEYGTDIIVPARESITLCYKIPFGSLRAYCGGYCTEELEKLAKIRKLAEYDPKEIVWTARLLSVSTADR